MENLAGMESRMPHVAEPGVTLASVTRVDPGQARV